MNDNVNNPSHYNSGGIECIDAMQSAMQGSELTPYEGYLWGNVIKYIWRWTRKNGVEDLKKCRWYLDKLIGEFEIEQGSEEG